ncbi:MAG: hypothetical protein P1V81_02045 [Planctomycetota bacterium]|nr:hypothetical protein [Planctomycetota bacterium]
MNLPLYIIRLLVLVFILGIGLSACNIEANTNELSSHGLGEMEGERCTVQLRRDYLGAETSLPIPPTTDVFNGAQVSIEGRLEEVGHYGLLLRSDGRDLWIPMEAILLVDFAPPSYVPDGAQLSHAKGTEGVPAKAK